MPGMSNSCVFPAHVRSMGLHAAHSGWESLMAKTILAFRGKWVHPRECSLSYWILGGGVSFRLSHEVPFL